MFLALMLAAPTMAAPSTPDPFARLQIYPGTWSVRATKPWSGAPAGATDRLISRCQRFAAYFTCEQTIAGKPAMLIVFTATGKPGIFNTRFIDPVGLAGARGDMVMQGNIWTYTDKPPAGLKGNWSRTVNRIDNRNRIRFEEYESADEGVTWVQINAGDERRMGEP